MSRGILILWVLITNSFIVWILNLLPLNILVLDPSHVQVILTIVFIILIVCVLLIVKNCKMWVLVAII